MFNCSNRDNYRALFMSKTFCPASCGKKFMTPEQAAVHVVSNHPDYRVGEVRRKGWATPYGFGDWKEPITYEEACNQMKQVAESIKWPAATDATGQPTPETQTTRPAPKD